MAYYAALASLVQVLEEISHNDRYQNSHFGKLQIMKSLHEKFSLLLVSLKDYSSKGDEATDCLEIRIRDAAYQAQDIIESQISEDKTHIVLKKIFYQFIAACQYVMCPRHRRREGFQDLQKVEEEVDSILGEVMTIKKSEDLQLNFYSGDVAGGSKQAPGVTSAVVGLDENLTTIKSRLCGEVDELQIIPITGMGGIGKTTLARNIFDDKLIVSHFDVRFWVTVSQDYNIQKVLHAILDSINGVTPEIRELSQKELSVYVYKHLKSRRYLIIMDDIWSMNVLDDVTRIFPNDSSGSRIVLTTRLSDVAAYADTFGSAHHMQFLNVEQSWNLLREKVFAQEPCPFELVYPGMQIAKNCRGLPLAIVAVAGILSKVRRTRNDWYNIASCVSLAVTENDEHFSRILTLSYNHLPHHLKACFLYFGWFPEDYEISVPRLIRLWIAEGFLRPNESKTLEEIGEEYLEDLVKRNLILMVKKRYNGRLRFCSIHDLLRDLCIKRVRYENFFHFTNEKGYLPQGRENVWRASLNHPFWDDRLIITDVVPDSHVRSIICFDGYSMNYKSTPFGFRLLRVLDALAIQLPSFPYKLLELFHLRYLALYLDPDFFTGSLELSPSISKLENLQTFIVGTRMLSLPSQIWELPQLRHLIITKMTISSLSVYPCLDVVLENLRTLQKIENLELNEHIVKRIPNLNKLKVRYTDPQRAHWEFYCLNNLAKLCKLEELNIIFDLLWDGANHFPESFAFPRNLKKLSLDGCRLPWENMTVVGSLPNLQSLKLKDYAFLGQKWETRDGEFLRLKFLLMKDLDLKCWRAENTHFPCLEHLKIRYCGDLEEIPLEIGEIPTLELIEVHESKSAAHSAMLIQEEQRSMGNDTLQVRVSQRKY